VIIQCPKCRAIITAPDKPSQVVKCRKCDAVIVVTVETVRES